MADVTSSPDLSSLLVVGGCVEHLLCELWDRPHIGCAPQARLLREKVGREGMWLGEGGCVVREGVY